jgi:hypothetical protein
MSNQDEGMSLPEGLHSAMLGPPPWQVLIQVRAADGTIRATHHGPALLSVDDTARIEFTLRDWQPVSVTQPHDRPGAHVHPGQQATPAVGLSGPSGGSAAAHVVGGGGAGSLLYRDLHMAALEDSMEDALGALAEVAKAAGVHTATMGARSITEVGQIIAARIREIRA